AVAAGAANGRGTPDQNALYTAAKKDSHRLDLPQLAFRYPGSAALPRSGSMISADNVKYSDHYDVAYPGQVVPGGLPSDQHYWYWWIKFLLARYNSNRALLTQPGLPAPPQYPTPTAADLAAYALYDMQLTQFLETFGRFGLLLVTPIIDPVLSCSAGSLTAVMPGGSAGTVSPATDSNMDGFVCTTTSSLGVVTGDGDDAASYNGGALPAGFTLRRVVPGTAGDADMDGVIAVGTQPYISQPAGPVAVIDFLEFTNEPNLQIWPQRSIGGGPDGQFEPANLIIDQVVAGMFVTAEKANSDLQAIPAQLAAQNGQGSATKLAGPASQDFLGPRAKVGKNGKRPSAYGMSTRTSTSVDFFTKKLLDALPASIKSSPGCTWTHHNYNDMTHRRFTLPGPGGTSAGPSTNIAQLVRGRLKAGGWSGMRVAGVSTPALMLTEGGVSRNNLPVPKKLRGANQRTTYVEHLQAVRLREAGRRLRRAPIGTGIALLTNFEFYQDASVENSSSLCRTIGLSKTTIPPPPPLSNYERPAYHAWQQI
ncbi:MAG: hypothetical protein M3065_01425, partial [Actinomycetota bacterium]|nr:hypothetical protein [Actinomycetota bacterium]